MPGTLGRRFRGFTLMEVMIAILFISIALFGYVSLHARVLHSGTKIKDREMARRTVATISSIDQVRAVNGLNTGVYKNPLLQAEGVSGLRIITADATVKAICPACVNPAHVPGSKLPYEVDFYILAGAQRAGW